MKTPYRENPLQSERVLYMVIQLNTIAVNLSLLRSIRENSFINPIASCIAYRLSTCLPLIRLFAPLMRLSIKDLLAVPIMSPLSSKIYCAVSEL